jgi:peptidoglycan/xylan/chitin deacetylase (PgdA/CDA1 family)
MQPSIWYMRVIEWVGGVWKVNVKTIPVGWKDNSIDWKHGRRFTAATQHIQKYYDNKKSIMCISGMATSRRHSLPTQLTSGKKKRAFIVRIPLHEKRQ